MLRKTGAPASWRKLIKNRGQSALFEGRKCTLTPVLSGSDPVCSGPGFRIIFDPAALNRSEEQSGGDETWVGDLFRTQ